jgi:hypothetical protein
MVLWTLPHSPFILYNGTEYRHISLKVIIHYDDFVNHFGGMECLTSSVYILAL